MARPPTPTWFFVLVVVRLGRRFLLVQEAKHGQSWCFAGGGLEAGERLVETAHRETLEESGVQVELEGVLRIEHDPAPAGHARVRVFFLARPSDDTPPKDTPDEHSLRAGWFTIDEMDAVPLRSPEVAAMCAHVLRGGQVLPLELLGTQGGRI